MNISKKVVATLATAIALPIGIAAAPAQAATGSCYISDSNGVELASAQVIGSTLYVNLGRGAIATGSFGPSPSLNDYTADNSAARMGVSTPQGRIPLRITWLSNTGVQKSNLCYIQVG